MICSVVSQKLPGFGFKGAEEQIEVHFCAIPVATNNGLFDTLFVSVDIDYCLIVADETIMKVKAAQPFCP